MIVPGAPVPKGTRRFGALRGKSRRRHNGVDLYAKLGDDVLAPIDGTVRLASMVWVPRFSGYGRFVVLDIGDGREMLFAHFDDVAVKAGQVVKRGDLLGTVGDTKFTRKNKLARFDSSKPHIHAELLRGRYPANAAVARLDPSELAFAAGGPQKKKRVFLVTVEEQ